jgi:hypothetical protein
LEREAASADEQLINSEEGGGEEEAWVATHTDRPQLRNNNVVDVAEIPDIDMEDITQDDEVRDMDIDDIPGLEDMQMPSDDESDDETNRKMYRLTHNFPY